MKVLYRKLIPVVLAALAVHFGGSIPAYAQAGAKPATAAKRGATPDFTGVYEIVPNGVTLPAGLKNAGSPEEISLQPSAAEQARKAKLEDDPGKNCNMLGPFRMMALEGNKIDILPTLSGQQIVMLFEDRYLGFWRTIFLDRPHDPKLAPLWQGDSIGRWEGETLVVDTTNFNEFTWLNAKGAAHSDALRLIERYRLLPGGEYLEVKMSAEDSKVLVRPYTYTRYYKRSNSEIQDYFCQDNLLKEEIPKID